MLFKGNSSRLQLLIEKIHAHKEVPPDQEVKEGGETEGGSSSETSSASSCPTPNSASSLQESDLAYTVGVTETTPYPCHFCHKAFPRLSYLKKHEQSHSEHMPFRCEYCLRLFKHKRSRDRHIKLHTGDKKYRCTKCEAAFSRSDHLKIHMKTHDNQKPFQCTVCNRGYNTAAALTSHMQIHKRNADGSLAAQEAATNNNNNNNNNINNNNNKIQTYKCLQCHEVFHKPEELTEHISTLHGESINSVHRKCKDSVAKTSLACIYCANDNFATIEALHHHVKTVHSNSQNDVSELNYNVVCPVCSIIVPVGSLESHTASLHGSTVRSHGSLVQTNHELTGWHLDTPSANKRPRLPFTTSDSLLQKRVEYSHPGVLLCSQCDAALPDFESFRRHVKCHLEERSSHGTGELGKTGANSSVPLCPYCGSSQPSSESLVQHIGTHLLARITDYGCNTCLRLFSTLDNLRRHLMDCHAFVAYRCCLCSDLFESKVAIEVHFTAKHCNEVKQYRCTACPNIAPLGSEHEFWLHIKTVHCNFKINSPTPPSIASPRLLRCVFCSMTFSTELEMQYHLSVHTKQYQCPVCSEGFHVEYLLEKHMQCAHGPETSSSVGEMQTDSTVLQLGAANEPTTEGASKKPDIPHNNNNNNNTKDCGICEAGDFASEAELNAHRKLVHHLKTSTTAKVSLHCAYCKENCKSRAELETHMKTHCQGGLGPGKHKCNICDELCSSAVALAEHKLTHCKVVHGTKCIQCKTNLTDEESFTAHLGQHGCSSLPAPCVICRQTLNTETEVMLHARLHLGLESNHAALGQHVSLLHANAAFTVAKEWSESSLELATPWKKEPMSQLAQLPVGWNFRPDLERQYKGHVLARAPSLLSDSQALLPGYSKGKSEICRSKATELIDTRLVKIEREDVSYAENSSTSQQTAKN
ncbi:zinc finger protein Lobe isoform X2 [Rhodnius prolixus]|uniref:C2H2-type domain-containing protein n=1 Tax=Rhodnius prolixus TaxID=13249 RepID=A0ABL0EJT7_RHOPR